MDMSEEARRRALPCEVIHFRSPAVGRWGRLSNLWTLEMGETGVNSGISNGRRLWLLLL